MDRTYIEKPSEFKPGAPNWGTPSALGEPNWGTPSTPGEPTWGTPSTPGGTGSWDALGSVLGACWSGLGGLLGRLRPRKVANMAPSWPPKRSQNSLKIDPKIDHFSDAFWNRFLGGFY